MKFETIGPLLRSAQVSIAGNRPGIMVGVSDVQRLQNPSRTAWLLDEIRFRFPVTQSGGGNFNRLVLPHLLSVQLDVGNLALTAARAVPIAVLCRAIDLSSEQMQGGSSRFFSPFESPSGYTWRFPKPLYVPAGKTVVPRFRLDGDIPIPPALGITATVAVSMVGRLLAQGSEVPRVVEVPFATAWRDEVRAGGADYRAIRSPRSDLANPHVETLFVQRLTGSYLYLTATGDLLIPGYPGPEPVGGGTRIFNTADMIGNDLVLARIVKSDDKALARSKTPFSHLFDWGTRAFDVCATMERNEYYQLRADLLFGTLAAGDRVRLSVGLIGYRRVGYSNGVYLEAA